MRRFLCSFLVTVTFFGTTFSEKKESRKKIEQQVAPIKKRLSHVKEKKETLQQALNQKRREEKFVAKDIEKVDVKLIEVEGKLERTTVRLSQNKCEQEKLGDELVNTATKLGSKEQLVRARLKAIYMNAEPSAWLTLAKSKSLGDFAIRKSALKRIAQHDRTLFNGLKKLKDSLNLQKSHQDQLVKEISYLASKQKVEQKTLESYRTEKQSYLKDLKTQQRELRRELDELESESRSLAAKILQYMAASKAENKQLSPYSGILAKPVPGRISSPYGWRKHPILKERRLHSGIDIAAGHGTPIAAAAPGVVIEARYRRGYGNMVLIDHGGVCAFLLPMLLGATPSLEFLSFENASITELRRNAAGRFQLWRYRDCSHLDQTLDEISLVAD